MKPIRVILVQIMQEETTNKQIKEIEMAITDEQRKLKASLIEDVFKAKKLLAGYGYHKHIEDMQNPAQTFDYLYDMEPEELEILDAWLRGQISNYIRNLHGLHDVGKD